MSFDEDGKQDVEPFGLGTGETLGELDGEGVLAGERLGEGNGNSCASSSSSIGDDRSLWRESRISGSNSSSLAELEEPELEDTSRS